MQNFDSRLHLGRNVYHAQVLGFKTDKSDSSYIELEFAMILQSNPGDLLAEEFTYF